MVLKKRSLGKKIAESSFSNLMVEIVITLLLDSEIVFFFPFGMIQIPYEPTRSETFDERLVLFDVFFVLSMWVWIWLVETKTCWFIYAMYHFFQIYDIVICVSIIGIGVWDLFPWETQVSIAEHVKTEIPNSGKQHTHKMSIPLTFNTTEVDSKLVLAVGSTWFNLTSTWTPVDEIAWSCTCPM